MNPLAGNIPIFANTPHGIYFHNLLKSNHLRIKENIDYLGVATSKYVSVSRIFFVASSVSTNDFFDAHNSLVNSFNTPEAPCPQSDTFNDARHSHISHDLFNLESLSGPKHATYIIHTSNNKPRQRAAFLNEIILFENLICTLTSL